VRALYLSYCYPPLRFPRSIQVGHLVRHTRLAGVTVMCGDDPEAPQDEELVSVAGDAPTVRLGWDARARALRLVRRRTFRDRYLAPDLYRPWARIAASAAADVVGRDDVLVSFAQPMSDHLAGRAAARRTGARWIAHFSDPWVDNPLIRRGAVARAVTGRQERAVVRDADALVFTSARTADLVMRKYPPAWRGKTSVIPHCFDERLYPDVPARVGPLVVRHVGNFYRGRGPAPLYEALAILGEQGAGLDDVRVELVGGSELDPLAEPGVDRVPRGVLRVRGKANYLEALALMRSADLLVLVDAPGRQSVFLPSKLIEYLGAGRPIVALTPPGEAADLVDAVGGWCAPPDRPDDAARALAGGLQAARGARDRDWGDRGALRSYSAAAVVASFDDLVESVASTRRG